MNNARQQITKDNKFIFPDDSRYVFPDLDNPDDLARISYTRPASDLWKLQQLLSSPEETAIINPLNELLSGKHPNYKSDPEYAEMQKLLLLRAQDEANQNRLNQAMGQKPYFTMEGALGPKLTELEKSNRAVQLREGNLDKELSDLQNYIKYKRENPW